MLEFLDGETCRLDASERVTVRVAPSRYDRPDALEPILPAGQPRIVRANVLGEEKRRIWPQHPSDLSESGILATHGTQSQRRDDRVKRRIGEWQRLSRGLDELDVGLESGRSPPRPSQHPQRRIGSNEPAHRFGIMRQVRASPDADLEHAATGGREVRRPQRVTVPALEAGADEVVPPRAEPFPRAGPQGPAYGAHIAPR